MRKPFVAGNWKMHKTLAEARELVQGICDRADALAGVDVLICPPVQLLFPMAKAVAGTNIMMGAQNVHEANSGAFTGEVSAEMLKDTGCTHVLVGHSERRQLFAEAGDRLAGKLRAAQSAGLHVIYCVGETLEQREAGLTDEIVAKQLSEAIDSDVDSTRLTIAYEPVWAIGTGKTATPEQAQEVHQAIRSKLGTIYGQATAGELRILYGGSVKPGNAAGLMGLPDIDGALVGGACLVAEDFVAIMSAAADSAAVV